jgi:single-strand DNA-binding protein
MWKHQLLQENKVSSTVTIIGNLTAKPEKKSIKSGSSLLNFSVAVNRRWRNKQDQWEEETSFFDCTAWSELADNIEASLDKGTRVIVTGRLEQQTWEGKDGKNASKVVLIAEDIGPSLRKAQVGEITKTGVQNGTAQSNFTPQSQVSTSVFDEEEPF